MTGDGPAGPEEACRVFVSAVAWGEHRRVWDMLGPDGRKTVLRVATSRGMDEALGMRLREGRATSDEFEAFLTDLVQGLRTDLAGTDLDRLEFELDPEAPAPGRAWVVASAPLPAPLAHNGGLPVGWFELAQDAGGGGWRIERLVPRSAR